MVLCICADICPIVWVQGSEGGVVVNKCTSVNLGNNTSVLIVDTTGLQSSDATDVQNAVIDVESLFLEVSGHVIRSGL